MKNVKKKFGLRVLLYLIVPWPFRISVVHWIRIGYYSFICSSLYIIRAMFIIIRGSDVLRFTFDNHRHFLCFFGTTTAIAIVLYKRVWTFLVCARRY